MSNIAYFDNAATTFPKPESVYNFADSFYRSSGGNIGRGGNVLAVAAGDIARKAKDNLRKLYDCPAREVVFTSSATDALNRILLGLDLIPGDHVYVTPFEHNAVTRPLHHLAKEKGVEIHVLPFDKKTLLPCLAEISNSFQLSPPRLVVLTHASNVCGAVVPVEEICGLAKKYEATTVLDMSQTFGLLPLNLANDIFDFAVFAGHKTLYGPFGVGGFICKRGARLHPVYFGGNGINSIEQDMPEDIVPMEEIASQNTYAIAGLKASTDWIIQQDMTVLQHKEAANLKALQSLLSAFPMINIIGEGMECERVGVVSALFDELTPDEAEMVLGRCGVAVRSGIQCSPYAHRFFGTLPAGTVRFSVNALESGRSFEVLEAALNHIEAAL